MNKIIAVEEITSGVVGENIRTHDVITSPNQPMIAGLGQNDLVTLNNLLEALVGATGGGEDLFIAAGSPFPAILINGTDFTVSSQQVIVQQLVSAGSTSNTNNGAGIVFHIEYTDATKTVIDYLILETTTSDGSTVDVDTWVRVV